MNWCALFAVALLAIMATPYIGMFDAGVREREWVGRNGFGWHTTAEEVAKDVDMTGKVALVTGSNSGLGFENCRVFAERGAHVILAARTEEKANKAIEQIKELLPSSKEYKMTPLACELGDLKSVDTAVAKFKSMNLPLHYLIANAGIMAIPSQKSTADGFGELQVGVNHIGHFRLVTQLMDVLTESKPSRVVMVSSLAHENAPAPRDFLESDTLVTEPYRPWFAYANSKLANIVFARELNERFQSQGVTSFSIHPGLIDTNLARDMHMSSMLDFLVRDRQWWMPRVLPLFGRTMGQGTATQVYAALKAPESEGGQYYSACNVQVVGRNYEQKDAELLADGALRAKFWETSEKIIASLLKN